MIQELQWREIMTNILWSRNMKDYLTKTEWHGSTEHKHIFYSLLPGNFPLWMTGKTRKESSCTSEV
jgi:hypothetical protein